MWNSRTAHYVTRYAPVATSALALAIVLEGVLEFGGRPPLDEGWQAHMFQLLLALQAPLLLVFVVTNWHSFRRELPVVGTQVLLWVLALGTVSALHY